MLFKHLVLAQNTVSAAAAGFSLSACAACCSSPAAFDLLLCPCVQACILDGSAMSNPAIAAKFPRRQRRGSASSYHGPNHVSETSKQHNGSSPSSPSSHSDTAATGTASSSQERSHGGRNSRHQGGSSHSTSAKNPFAATPKNIRQQQLLCNLMAAADCFTDGAAPAGPGAGASSRGASLDYSAMPPPVPGSVPAAGRPSMDRPSMDMSSMSRATSRTSLESWGYMNRGRNSCDMGAGNRASMESYSASMRSSMDRASCWSGRPSVDSTFSAYAPPSPQILAQQQQQVAAAAAAAAVAARASFEAALPPTPAGNSLNRMGMWQAGRASCDLGALSPSVGNSAFCRYSLDSAAENQVAAAAAAAASAMQMEQQRSMSGLLRFDSSGMSNVSGSSIEGANTSCPASPATPAELAAAAAAMAARRNQVMQLQNIIDSMSAGTSSISGDTAAALANLTAQGVSPDTAALLLLQAQQNAAAAAADCSGRGNGLAPEAMLFQQQLQQIMQANQMAAAAASSAAQAAAASQLYAATAARNQASQRRQQGSQRWQNLGFDASEAELLQEQEAPRAAAYDAAALQQQLELLQRMQL